MLFFYRRQVVSIPDLRSWKEWCGWRWQLICKITTKPQRTMSTWELHMGWWEIFTVTINQYLEWSNALPTLVIRQKRLALHQDNRLMVRRSRIGNTQEIVSASGLWHRPGFEIRIESLISKILGLREVLNLDRRILTIWRNNVQTKTVQWCQLYQNLRSF